jgi:carbon storage regulator CsrA
MLVLERNLDEWIVIKFGGQVVKVKVCQIKSDRQVRIGIEAPPNVVVHRAELENFDPQKRRRAFRSARLPRH